MHALLAVLCALVGVLSFHVIALRRRVRALETRPDDAPVIAAACEALARRVATLERHGCTRLHVADLPLRWERERWRPPVDDEQYDGVLR